jgi:hypothetical protein
MKVVKTIQNIWFADTNINLYQGGPTSDKAISCWWSTAIFCAKFIAGLGLGGAASRSFPRAQWKLGSTGLALLAIFTANHVYHVAFWPPLSPQDKEVLIAPACKFAVSDAVRREELLNNPALLTEQERRAIIVAICKARSTLLPRHFFWLPQPALGRVGAVSLTEGIACCLVLLCTPAVLARITAGFPNPRRVALWGAAAVVSLLLLGMQAVRYYEFPPWVVSPRS